MVCKCRICRNDLQETVSDWHQDGLTLLEISERLFSAYELSVNPKVIHRHFEAYGIVVDAPVSKPAKVTRETTLDAPALQYDLNAINFDRYDFDEDKPLEIIAYLQKCLLHLCLEQIEITCSEQQMYKQGLTEASPHSSFLRLKMLLEMLDKYTGISVYANQQSAIRTVEMMGLKIERFGILTSEHENVSD